ncbi:MAG: DUF692 domain-containing protein [bacterium]|nr:DUF692 domain-containing protein [bacterium]
MGHIPVGSQRYLALCDELLRTEVDYFEVAPETTWRTAEDGTFVPNGYHAYFARLKEETEKPLVAHGVGWSPGTVQRDAERSARWLERIRTDHAQFGFEWYTDHLGATELAGLELTLPMPLPMTPAMVRVVRASLEDLQRIVPRVGLENSVFYFHLGDPLDEPAFLGSILDAPRMHLLLDLHNVHTTAVNAGFEPERYLERLPFERVIEIHVSGGSESDPAWLPSGRVLRLDSHDAAVPEEVWRLLDWVLPRCPNACGVTLERMEGTVEENDVAVLRDELRRARRAVEAARV